MASNTKNSAAGPALQSAKRLAEREIERLKEELELIKASTHPRRRSLIIDYVHRIDERQDALERLEVIPEGCEQRD